LRHLNKSTLQLDRALRGLTRKRQLDDEMQQRFANVANIRTNLHDTNQLLNSVKGNLKVLAQTVSDDTTDDDSDLESDSPLNSDTGEGSDNDNEEGIETVANQLNSLIANFNVNFEPALPVVNIETEFHNDNDAVVQCAYSMCGSRAHVLCQGCQQPSLCGRVEHAILCPDCVSTHKVPRRRSKRRRFEFVGFDFVDFFGMKFV
jgi:hypothetical protein